MPKKYWFVPKTYGYGLVPSSWEGWLATLLLIFFLGLSAYAHNFWSSSGPNFHDSAHFLFDLGVLTGLFLLLCKDKTDGELKWRWGEPKQKN